MFWLALLLCVACTCNVQSTHLRPSSKESLDDTLWAELFKMSNEEWQDNLSDEYRNPISRRTKIWSPAQAAGTHINPCSVSVKEWKTSNFVKQPAYDFQPEFITVKKCQGTVATNKRACAKIMDCVTQLERKRFLRKTKGSPCSSWHSFERDIPIGCECMRSI